MVVIPNSYFNMKNWLFIILGLLVASCDFKPEDIKTPEWDLDLLGPLAKSDLTVEEILETRSVTFARSLSSADVGLQPPGSYPNLPANYVPIAGPYRYTLSDSFIDLKVLTGSYFIKVKNNLPLTINSGVKIFATDTTNTDTIFKFHLTQNLPKGQTFSTKAIDISGKLIPNRINLWAQDISNDAINSPIVIRNDAGLDVSFSLDNFSINYVRIAPIHKISFADTAAVNTEGDIIKSNALTGKIKMYVLNGMPIQTDMQIYLLDGNKILIDSFFTERVVIPSANVSPVSYTATSPDSALILFNLDSKKIASINKTKYIYPKAVFRTMNPSFPYVKITKNDNISIQIVGDLNLKINSN